jgi:hypothetical protein
MTREPTVRPECWQGEFGAVRGKGPLGRTFRA